MHPGRNYSVRRVVRITTILSFLTTVTATAETTSLCAVTEEPVLSCSVGSKIASLCTSTDLTADSGYLYYAFGKKDAVELSFPKEKNTSRRRFRLGATNQGQLDVDYARFTNAGYRYTIYSAESGSTFLKEGVMVEKGGKVISSLVCHDSVRNQRAWRKLGAALPFIDTDDGFKVPQAGPLGATNSLDGFFYGWISAHGKDRKDIQVTACFSSTGQSVFFNKAAGTTTVLTKQGEDEWVESDNETLIGRWRLTPATNGGLMGNWLDPTGQSQGQIRLAKVYLAVQPAAGCDMARPPAAGESKTLPGKTPYGGKPLRAVSVKAESSHTCAVLSDGSVKCWGDNSNGQLGRGNRTSVTDINVAGAVSIAGSCAVLRDGRVTCWSGSRPPEYVAGVTNAVALADTGRCALLGNGRIRCWGPNEFGQRGNGNTDSTGKTVDVIGIDNAVAVSAYALHACAALSDGQVKCWGNQGEREGKFGGPEAENTKTTPYVVPLVHDAVAVSAGGQHNCAVLRDGKVQCWGFDNDHGQLGVPGAEAFRTGDNGQEGGFNIVTVEGISNAKSVSAGQDYSCALLSTGAIKCWGISFDGQLGNGSNATVNTVVTVLGITNATAVSAGYQHTCALLAGGQVKCWGRNYCGQLGSLVAWTSGVGTGNATSVIGFGGTE